MKMGKLSDLKDARAENAEARSWQCATCDTMVEAEGAHCRACAQYWQDCDDGMFDDDYLQACEAEANCSLMPDGQCLQAGSEYCDLECPYRK